RRAAGSAILILEERACAGAPAESNARARVSKDEDGHGMALMLRDASQRNDAGEEASSFALRRSSARGARTHGAFGETKPMGSMPACSMRNRPAVAGSDRRRRSIVSGLLFTMNGATRTGIWRSETLAPAKRGEGGERRRRDAGDGRFLACRIRFNH